LEMQKYPQDIINGSPIQKPEHIIAKSFWCAIPTKIASRLLFSDWHLESWFINDFDKDISTIIETKQEVSIWRHLEGKDSNPRSIERINPWVIFSGTITLIPYEGELSTYNKNTGNYTTLKTAISEEELKEILIDGMNLIEQTYLWWYGSRWCGQVKFICPALWFTETDSPTS
jgi:CRISPR/Cas system CSM-associated protein Csm3 (group 7 of RAMP superfamily)